MRTVRNPVAEGGFRKIYNLVVNVEQGRECNNDGTFKQTKAIIKSAKGTEYTIDEFLKGNLTDYCMVGEQRFDKYITAEKYVAEQIKAEV